MNENILWSNDYNIKVKQDNNIKKDTDILIIGGGITGLSVAYFLKDLDKNVILIDKGQIGCGVTFKTTGKISYVQGNIYGKLNNNFNKNVSKLYFDSQMEAVNIIKNIITTNNIDCDLERVKSVIFTLEDKNIKKIEEEKIILNEFGVNVQDINNDKVKRTISVDDTYTFNPIKYLNGLSKIINNKINIYENVIATNIEEVDNKYLVTTNRGVISSEIVVVASHYPYFIVPTFIPFKTYIKREYVNVGKMKHNNLVAINIDNCLHSIRFYKDNIIYGSNKHKLTSKINYKKNYDKSKIDFKKYFSKNPDFTWMNQDIVSNDLLPFIGEIKHNLYIATAFNGWGMTCGSISGKIISDLIVYKNSKYKELFSPERNNLNLLLTSLIGSFSYLKAYTISLFKKNNPEYITIKGINYGVYTDDDGVRHFIKIICPHMKCHLVFNKEEKTWDCPCHGSRFDIDGNLIEGPAKENINGIN